MFYSGDRVKYIGTFTEILQGQKGTVVGNTQNDVIVEWDDESLKGNNLVPAGVMSGHLELIPDGWKTSRPFSPYDKVSHYLLGEGVIVNSNTNTSTVEFDEVTVTFVQNSELTLLSKSGGKGKGTSRTVKYVHEAYAPKNPGREPVTALDEAKKLVYGNRQNDYGHPAYDYERVAQIWTGILGVEVTRLQAIQCMIGIKLSRLSNSPHHKDSWVDIAGYAECGDRIRKFELGEEDAS